MNYGVYKVDRDPDRPNQLLKIFQGSDSERNERRAKAYAKKKNDERNSEEKRYIRHTVRKISDKKYESPEVQEFLNADKKRQLIQSIIEDGDYYGKREFDYPLGSVMKEFFHKYGRDLTLEDLYDWDWDKAVVSTDTEEQISVRNRASMMWTTVEFAIPLNGEVYELKTSRSRDIHGI